MKTDKQLSKEAILDRLLRIDATCDSILEEIVTIRNILEEEEDSIIKRLRVAADNLNNQSIAYHELIQRAYGVMRIEGRCDDDL